MNADLVRDVIETEVSALASLADQLGPEIRECVSILKSTSGNILVSGMGTSGSVARRTAHLLGCCGAPAFFVHPSDQQHGASGAIRAGDTILVFSKGGESVEINTFLKMAQGKGCRVIALTGTAASSMTHLTDKQIVFTVPPDSEPFGKIATTSSLAAGLVSDILCILYLQETGYSEEEFGKTHPGGLVGKMVKGMEDR